MWVRWWIWSRGSGGGVGLNWWVSRWVAWWWHGGYVFIIIIIIIIIILKLFVVACARGRGMLGVL